MKKLRIRNEDVTTADLYKAVKYDIPDIEPDRLVNGVFIYIGRTKADLDSDEAKRWFQEKTMCFRNTPLSILETEDKKALHVIMETGRKYPLTMDLQQYTIEGVTVLTTDELYKNRLLELRFCVIANFLGGFHVNPGDGMLPDLTPDCWTCEPWPDRYQLICPYEFISTAVHSVKKEMDN